MTTKTNSKLFDVLMSDDVIEPTFNCRLQTMSNKRRKAFRVHLAVKQTLCCHYCRTVMTLLPGKSGQTANNYATFEHLIDIFSAGKKDDCTSKIVLACLKCNSNRGSARCEAALKHYGNYLNRLTLHKLVRYAGWQKIIKAFGPMPN